MTTQEFDKAVKAFVLAYRTGPEASISNGQVATKREDDDDWVTIKGTHVLLNENGEAQGGGNLKGMTFSKAKTQNGGAEEKHESAFKTKGEYKPGNTFTEWQRANMVGRDNPTRKALSNIFKEEGIEGVMKEYYSSRTASSTKDLHHISDSEADEILYDHMPQNVFTGWFRDANSEYKPRVVNAVTASPEARNASLSIMYDNYRELTGGKMGYEEFLNTPVQMYRGGHGQEHTNDDIFSSFSFDRGVAEKFAGKNGTVYEAKIRPIDTWGSVTTNKESEIMVPSWITPNKHKDGRTDDGGWITVNSTHVLLDKNGEAQSSGKLKGMTFSKAKSSSGEKESRAIERLNARVKGSYGKGSYTDTLNEIRKSVRELPVGGRIRAGSTTFEKVGENEYRYEWNHEYHPGDYATASENYVVNNCNSHEADKAPIFESGKSTSAPMEEKGSAPREAEGPDKENGLNLYKTFIEGGSWKIHKALGVDMLRGGKFDPASVDEKAARDIDSVFTPSSGSKGTKPLYKGISMTKEEIDGIRNGKVFLNHTISSTSSDTHTARDYADNAYETEDRIPVFMKIKVEDGTPVANTRQLFGTSGMKGYEKEITIGRNTEWKYGKLKNVGDDEDPYYEVEVTVRPATVRKKAKDSKFDSAYDEWLEENLDKFESDDEELEFAKWKNKDGIKARDCNDVDTVDSMWKEYKTKRGDSNDSQKTKVRLSGAKDFFNTLLTFGNKYISKKIIDIASKSDIIKIEGNITHTDADVDSWITLENGEHVPLNNSGEAVGGAGGWAKGKDFSDAKSSEPEKGTKEKPSANGWNVPCKGFRDDASARRHEKHWPEFGFKSREEYEKAGIKFISQPVGGDIDGYLRYKNGVAQIIRFNRKTGEMGIGVPGREMITYYKAKCNKSGVVNLESANNYFNKLKEREAA